ncbi:MAG TPA: zinc metallopeptidase [Candidatus Fimenecus excrementigallinarum]|uniref:Zinc metallopeptidase n=1 Tax=Candidatus Fimenecus excrementigallinarum TaxID=2840816 RepID=A0A9D1IFN3_9FIRM|nr:zinc metallopeptidase [Candidatus Fimenecus excrementigallinarum]
MDLYYYLLLVVPALLLSLIAQARVQSAYKRYSKLPNLRGLTGARAAEAVLAHYGVQGVRIEHVRGRLNDHYDPRDNVIRLSDGVYGGCSVAAVGIACHEAGHAAQYALGYVPIRVRNGLLRPAQIGSQISWPLAIVGLFLGSQPLVLFGIILYVAVMLFQLITLPVEFNASRRALAVIDETGLLSGAERDGAAKVLRAAAMTYVAAFAVTAANLLRLLLLANRRN